MPGGMRERIGRWRLLVGTMLSALLVAGGAARTGGTVLLSADTNRAAVKALELDYDPMTPRLRVAVTVSGNFVKRAEYTDREAIRTVLEILRFQQSRELSVTFEENRLLTFHAKTR